MTIAEVRALLARRDADPEAVAALAADPRKGVQTLLAAYMRRMERENAEIARVEAMYHYESELYKKGVRYIAGIDEVGRGPLAGPVTVAAVILPPHWFAAGLNDSKKVTPKHREELAQKIHEEAEAVSIVSLPPEEIDALNIYEATMMAMYEAVKRLPIRPEAVIVDAMPLHFQVPTLSLVHGDARSATGTISWMNTTGHIPSTASRRIRATARRSTSPPSRASASRPSIGRASTRCGPCWRTDGLIFI